MLLAPEATAWLVDLLQRAPPGGGGGGGGTGTAVQAARRLLVLLCGVSGDIFMPPRPSGASPLRSCRLKLRSFVHRVDPRNLVYQAGLKGSV